VIGGDEADKLITDELIFSSLLLSTSAVPTHSERIARMPKSGGGALRQHADFDLSLSLSSLSLFSLLFLDLDLSFLKI